MKNSTATNISIVTLVWRCLHRISFSQCFWCNSNQRRLKFWSLCFCIYRNILYRPFRNLYDYREIKLLSLYYAQFVVNFSQFLSFQFPWAKRMKSVKFQQITTWVRHAKCTWWPYLIFVLHVPYLLLILFQCCIVLYLFLSKDFWVLTLRFAELV